MWSGLLLTLFNNTALIQLFCGGNQLTALDVSNNTALTHMSCGNNQLKTLDLSNNPALRSLSCSGNNLLKTIILCRDYLPEFQSTVNLLKQEYTVKFAEIKRKALNQMIRSLSLYSAGESNSDCKIENLEY